MSPQADLGATIEPSKDFAYTSPEKAAMAYPGDSKLGFNITTR